MLFMKHKKISDLSEYLPIAGGLVEYSNLRKKGVPEHYAKLKAFSDEVIKDSCYLLFYAASKFF